MILIDKPAWCHFCHTADTKWQRGPVWVHIWCGFRIPAAHVWFPGEDRHETQQLDMFESEAA